MLLCAHYLQRPFLALSAFPQIILTPTLQHSTPAASGGPSGSGGGIWGYPWVDSVRGSPKKGWDEQGAYRGWAGDMRRARVVQNRKSRILKVAAVRAKPSQNCTRPSLRPSPRNNTNRGHGPEHPRPDDRTAGHPRHARHAMPCMPWRAPWYLSSHSWYGPSDPTPNPGAALNLDDPAYRLPGPTVTLPTSRASGARHA